VTLADRTGSLGGEHVELVPLAAEFAAELAAAASVERSSYGFTDVPPTEDAMATYIRRLVAQRDADLTVPFAQREVVSGRLVGCTRYLSLLWWRERQHPDEVEIGGTWLAADVQRTAINTEAKLLLLSNAFETWEVVRVAICTDDRNERSRAAITRLGATFEGVLRQHRPSQATGEQGQPRNTAVFSILDTEWPTVKRRLTDRLAGHH
jgi:RimJ/RimL family protein N-acetyltransferase